MPELTIAIDSSSSDEDNSFTTQWRMPRRLIVAETRGPIAISNTRPHKNEPQQISGELLRERLMSLADDRASQNQDMASNIQTPVSGTVRFQPVYPEISLPIQQPFGNYGGSISSHERPQPQFSPSYDENPSTFQSQNHQPHRPRMDPRNSRDPRVQNRDPRVVSRDPRVQNRDPRTENWGQNSGKSAESTSYGEHRRRQAEKTNLGQKNHESRWNSDKRPPMETEHSQPHDKRQKPNQEYASTGENSNRTNGFFRNARENSQDKSIQNDRKKQSFAENSINLSEKSQNLPGSSQNLTETFQKHQSAGENNQQIQEISQVSKEIEKNSLNISEDLPETSKESKKKSSKSENSTKLLNGYKIIAAKENYQKTAVKNDENSSKRSDKSSSNSASSSGKKSQKGEESETSNSSTSSSTESSRKSEKSQTSANSTESRTKVLHLDHFTQQNSTDLAKVAEETSKELPENPQVASESSNKEKNQKNVQETSTSETATFSTVNLQLTDPNPSQIPGLNFMSPGSLQMIPLDQIKKEQELTIDASLTNLMDTPSVTNVVQIKKEIKEEHGNDDETDSNCDSNADTEDEMSENPIAGMDEDFSFLEKIQNGAGTADQNKKVTLEEEAQEDAAEAMQSFIRCIDLHNLVG